MQDVSRLTLSEIENELRQRELDDPLGLVYHPHEIQRLVHRSRKPIALVVGGNRSGKTYAAVAEALYYATGRRTWAEVPTPPVFVAYVMPSLPMFRRTVLPIVRKLAPRSEIRLTPNGDIISTTTNVIKFKNGSEIHFLSADMHQRRLQGFAADLVIMDETPKEDVYEELLARLGDRKGRMLMVFAPLDVQTYWVRDKLYTPWTAGDRTDVDIIHMPVADREGNPLVPHFTRADIERMERQWPDPNVRAARMYGEFVTRTGLIFRSFSPEVHVIPPFKLDESFARFFVVDPQYHRFAALYMAVDSAGNYYVTDEYFSQDQTLSYRAERMKVIVGDRTQAVAAYVDSANPQDRHELNWHFSRIGAPIGATELPFAKHVDKMVLRVHALLEPDEKRLYPKMAMKEECYGAPRLFLFNTLMSTWKWNERDMQCSRLIWETQRYSWDKYGKPDKTSADGADCSDCLTYACSILQTGVTLPQEDEWMKKMPLADAVIWKAIEQQDRRQRILAREW